jgi:hypothetical protein
MRSRGRFAPRIATSCAEPVAQADAVLVALPGLPPGGRVVAARHGRPTEMYTLVAVVYPVICFSLSKAVERRWKTRS